MMSPEVGDIWFRYEDKLYASGINEDGDWSGHTVMQIHLREFQVAKVTPKGVQLATKYKDYVCGDDLRFVRLDARKRFACPTREEAKESFIARKNKQAQIYQSRLERAKKAIWMIENKTSDLDYTMNLR